MHRSDDEGDDFFMRIMLVSAGLAIGVAAVVVLFS